MLVNEQLELQPVNEDTIKLIIYNPSYLLSSQRSEKKSKFRCFPNPVINRQLYLSSPERLEEARIYNLTGKEMLRIPGPGTSEWATNLPYSCEPYFQFQQADADPYIVQFYDISSTTAPVDT